MKVLRSLLLFSFLLNTPIHGQESSFDESKTEVVLRMVGHQLLLANLDSTSRVLPVKKLSENQFQLRFSSQIKIHPDSLVSVITAQMTAHKNETAYIVKVKNCLVGDVVYSFAILDTKQTELIPCKDRILPKDCYLIEIEFEKDESSNSLYLVFEVIVGLLLLAFVFRRRFTRKAQTANNIQIGQYDFDVEKQILYYQKELIDLTNKEAKLLKIFAESQNQIIERTRLQKEVWEDEGVIVGRSLDMYISKLRKILSKDISITLANEHGKGYTLKVEGA